MTDQGLERMTDERFKQVDEPSSISGIGALYNELRAEARRARASEDEKTREVMHLERWLDALAGELAHAISGRMGVEERRDGYREAAKRLREYLDGTLADMYFASNELDGIIKLVGCGTWETVAEEVEALVESRKHAAEFARDLGSLLGIGPDEKFDDAARRVVADRNEARAEVERLTRERDEAREKATLDEQALDEACRHWHEAEAQRDAANKRWEETQSALQGAEGERDAARKEADRLRAGFERFVAAVAFGHDEDLRVSSAWLRDPHPSAPDVLSPAALHALIQETLGHA